MIIIISKLFACAYIAAECKDGGEEDCLNVPQFTGPQHILSPTGYYIDIHLL